MAVTITTNNVPRDIIYGYELTESERAEFDYIDWQKVEDGTGDIGEFVRYKGQLYDLNDTEGKSQSEDLAGWDMYISDSFFSGVVFRYPREPSTYCPDRYADIDTEHIIVGRYYVS
jgi:hypothetical protein